MIVGIYLLHTIGERSLLVLSPAFYANSGDEEFGVEGAGMLGLLSICPFSFEANPQPHFLLY
jgi:hypothetical protein